MTPTDEELAELKKELERKNPEFAQQIDAFRLFVENNDELSLELEKVKADLEDIEKDLQKLTIAIWKLELKSPLVMSLSRAYELQ